MTFVMAFTIVFLLGIIAGQYLFDSKQKLYLFGRRFK
jgi:hypothetical protein